MIKHILNEIKRVYYERKIQDICNTYIIQSSN